MKKINEKYHHLCITVSAVSMVLSAFALIISVIALVKSCAGKQVSTREFDGCGADGEDFIGDDEEELFF